MGVFSAAPKSFKVDRKSHFGAKLKSLIFDHLRHFCPDYADDVLAEYITVLVCNGKNQNQAKEDLEAFLGEKSEEFISWLWDILLKYEPPLSAGISSDRKEKTSSNSREAYEENDNRNGKFRGLQSEGNSESDNLMGKVGEEVYCLTAKACILGDMLSSEVHHSRPAKETRSTTIQSSGLQRKSANVNSSIKAELSSGEHQNGSFDNSEAVEKPSSVPRRHQGSFPDSGSLPSIRSSRGIKLSEHVNKTKLNSSCIGEHPQMHCCKAAAPGRSISPLPLAASSHGDKPRRSVWDRLGKPQEDVPSRGQTAEFDVMENMYVSKERVGQRPPAVHKRDNQIVELSSSLPRHRDSHVITVREVHQTVGDGGANKINDSKGVNDVGKRVSQGPSLGNMRRKRHFGDLVSQIKDDAAVGGVLQARKRPEIQLEASQVVDSVHDVKLRLHQVEIEMAKLRSKQIEIEKDEKTKLLMNHGVGKAAEEDTDLRTILVTNVHYKATREALSMYFGKCGAVVNVVIFADAKPFATQRSAYITFGSKESADRALGFSGTTFYSRTILVSRKGEKAGASSAKLAGGRSQVYASEPKCGVTHDKSSFTSSHLQWRRESLTSTHPESPASNVGQMNEVAGSSFQQKGSATSVSEQFGDSNQCSSASADKPSEAEM